MAQPGQPSFSEEMLPAVEWARKNKPEELAEIYPNDQMVFNERDGQALGDFGTRVVTVNQRKEEVFYRLTQYPYIYKYFPTNQMSWKKLQSLITP